MDYQKIYDQICANAKKQTIQRLKNKKSGEEYYEGHHIIPKCFGGLGRSNQYNHPNIVLLTAREHFIVHWILYELNADNRKMAFSFDMMCKVKDKRQKRYIPSSRVVEYAKKQASLLHHSRLVEYKAINGKNKKGKSNVELFGVEKAKEIADKKSNTLKDTYIKDQSLKDKKSQSMKGKNVGPQKRFTCPNCGKIGGLSTMKQKHVPKCKLIYTANP